MPKLLKIILLSAAAGPLVVCQAHSAPEQVPAVTSSEPTPVAPEMPPKPPSRGRLSIEPGETAGAAPTAVPKTESAPPTFTKGKVVEVLSGGGYTYVCVENAGQKRWAAMPPTEVQVGQEVELAPGMEMHNFTSKTLGRKFEWITFCSGLASPKVESRTGAAPSPRAEIPRSQGSNPGMPTGHPAVSGSAPSSQASPIGGSPVAGKVVETLSGGSYTYAAVEKDGKRTWVALPTTKLEPGQEVEFAPGTVMTNFRSKALNRTFESIVFSNGLRKPR